MRKKGVIKRNTARRQVEPLRTKAAKIDVILTSLYGRKEIECDEDPMDTLVETILSQNTTDKNSHKAFQILKRAYPKWELLIDENPKRVAGLIRTGGLADIKAGRILDALAFIKKARGELRLDFLRDLTPSEAEGWLAQMKGVGPKTRGIVLLFALRMPAFPVDTHIHRVTKRLGLIGRKTSREMAQEELADIVPSAEYYNFHINLIEHGRAVCQARKPMCGACRIRKHCDFHSNLPPART